MNDNIPVGYSNDGEWIGQKDPRVFENQRIENILLTSRPIFIPSKVASKLKVKCKCNE